MPVRKFNQIGDKGHQLLAKIINHTKDKRFNLNNVDHLSKL